MRRPHSYSPVTLASLELLGLRIATARRERRWTVAELADRAGISPNTLRSAERGAATVSAGVMLELATLLGVGVLAADVKDLDRLVANERARLDFMPARVREPSGGIDDDF
ncbi:helix-turn-helix transcriptional regulator [Actinotalea sp. C106]|uniref:helix-turn-helix domain-containing protein n=1 Tax=Actinotalea sp. C106 TaxID=2908644 RepID=UPI0020280E3C|nr:helix-turn-helix transcriptional regulator [Actinotalea sp. C106]